MPKAASESTSNNTLAELSFNLFSKFSPFPAIILTRGFFYIYSNCLSVGESVTRAYNCHNSPFKEILNKLRKGGDDDVDGDKCLFNETQWL